MQIGQIGRVGRVGLAPATGVGWWSRPSNMLLGDDGDSRMDNGTTLSSSTRYVAGVAFQGWALALGANCCEYSIDNSFGVADDTIAGMKARMATTFAGSAGALVVLCDTNTFAGGGDLATATADMAAYLDAAGAARKVIFLVTGTPRETTANGGTISPENYANLIAFHEWQRDAAPIGRPWVRPVDLWSVLADGTGRPLAGMLRDGLHPSFLGAKTGGAALQTALEAFFRAGSVFAVPALNSDLFNALTNPGGLLVANPLLAGTGGSVGSGITNNGLAASWSLTRNTAASAMTFACSKEAVTDRQVITFSGTPTSSGANITLFQDINVANLSLGDVLKAFADVECIGLTNVERVSCELLLTATQSCTARSFAAWTGQAMPSDQRLALVCPRLPVTTGFTAVRLSIVVLFAQGSACSGTVKIGAAGPRKVL